MRAVVTGAGGLIGSHLVAALADRGDSVQAWVRRPVSVGWPSAVETVIADLRDSAAIARLLKDFAPDTVFHLAAQSSPGLSWQDPSLTYAVNVIGTVHLLEAARGLAHVPRLLLAGSSAEYAEPRDGRAIREDAPTEPNSPYGASKLAMVQLAQLYVRRYALDIICFRPFFLAGPRKIGDVCSDFARRTVAIERGTMARMRVGNLEVVRDLMDVRDGVTAILRLAEAGEPGAIYNVASGRGTSISTILEIYRSLATLPIEVVQDPALLRSLEPNVRIGDPGELLALGWRPSHGLHETLQSILDYWRAEP